MRVQGIICIFLLGFFSSVLKADSLGLDFQAYPAGISPSVLYSFELNDGHQLFFGPAMNLTRRNDWGVQDDERGVAYGIHLEYRYGLENLLKGLALGAQLHQWYFDIDWKQDAPALKGASTLYVFQPSAVLSYSMKLFQEDVWAALKLSLGAEVNLATWGREVGQGLIFLVGFQLFFDLP